jgi:hypothetical protein
MWCVLFLWTEFIYAHCLYMCSLSLHMLTVFIYVMLSMMLLLILFSLLLSLCFVANDVALYLTFVNSKPMPLCQWSFGCYTIWALVLSLSSLPSLVCDEIVELQKLFGIWADDLELVRNLASLPAAPTVFVDMLTIFIYAHYFYDAFMLQHFYQMMIDMFWDLLSLLICSLFL